MISLNDQGDECIVLADGTYRRLGLIPADMDAMRSAPQYAEAFPAIPKSQWPKKGGGLRGFMPFVWDQGQQGSCGGHGGDAAFTAAWNYQFAENRTPLEFSPTFLYGLCNGGKDQGSTPQDLRAALLDQGTCLRSTVGPGQIYSRNFPASALTEAKRFRAGLAPVVTTFEDMVSASLRGHALFSGIFCGKSFKPNSQGVVPEWDRATVGGHCTAQIGEFEVIDGKPGLWTLNSWSKSWGVDGWCWLPRSYFDGGLPAFGAVAIVSCLPDPGDATPTPTPSE